MGWIFWNYPSIFAGEEEIQYYLDKVDIDREALAKECSQNVCKISVERLPLSKLPVQPPKISGKIQKFGHFSSFFEILQSSRLYYLGIW